MRRMPDRAVTASCATVLAASGLLLLLSACQSAPVVPAAAAAQDDRAAQASAFMVAYAHDVSSGDRAALAALYHPDGAWIVGEGGKAFESHADLVQFYAQDWRAPASFEWHDLSYEPVGTGILVIGTYEWWNSGRIEPEVASYTALLVPVDGALRIRLEDQSRGRIERHGP